MINVLLWIKLYEVSYHIILSKARLLQEICCQQNAYLYFWLTSIKEKENKYKKENVGN